MKRSPSLLLSLCLTLGMLSTAAQATEWHNPIDSAAVARGVDNIHGRGFCLNNYTRLPESAHGIIRDAVWGLAQNSAGLYLEFTTNSPELTVRYEVTGGHAMPHMPATGVSGVDLYNERGQRCWGSYSFGTPITYSYKQLPDSTQGCRYTLYLPLYNTVRKLEIGVRDGSSFAFIPADKSAKPIVIYGTSIAQGACASRPGMAWSNLLHRQTGQPIVNLGFSGNGRLEREVIDYIVQIPASLYIVDCMPNMDFTEDSIYTLVLNTVHQIRESHPQTPILLTEHPGYANRETNAYERNQDALRDRAQRKAYAQLQKEGVKGLHYLSREELGMPADALVDIIHPSDYGMEIYARAHARKVAKILKLKLY